MKRESGVQHWPLTVHNKDAAALPAYPSRWHRTDGGESVVHKARSDGVATGDGVYCMSETRQNSISRKAKARYRKPINRTRQRIYRAAHASTREPRKQEQDKHSVKGARMKA